MYRARTDSMAWRLAAAVLVLVLLGAVLSHMNPAVAASSLGHAPASAVSGDCCGHQKAGPGAGAAHCAAPSLCWSLPSAIAISPKPALARHRPLCVVATLAALVLSPPDMPPRPVA